MKYKDISRMDWFAYREGFNFWVEKMNDINPYCDNDYISKQNSWAIGNLDARILGMEKIENEFRKLFPD